MGDVETNQGFRLENLGVCWVGRHFEGCSRVVIAKVGEGIAIS